MFPIRLKLLFPLISILVIFGLLAGCSSAKPATTGGFKISVLDSKNQPIIGATIATTNQPEGQIVVTGITSADVNPVNFETLIPGQYSWKVSKTGYVDTVININIVAGQSTGLSVTLNQIPSVTTQ